MSERGTVEHRMMPSHRREQAGPALQVLPFACSKPSSLVDLYHQSHPHHRSSATLGSFLSSPLDSMESWFPVSTGMDHTRDCRSAILNAQHHDTVTNNNIADFHLTELQTQQWWPTSIASQGRQQQSDGRESDLKLDSRKTSCKPGTSCLVQGLFYDDRRVISSITSNRFRKVTFILCVNSGAEPPFSGKH